MKIAVASDHGGFALKETVREHLKGRGFEVVDLSIILFTAGSAARPSLPARPILA